jgi:hypothetical protein
MSGSERGASKTINHAQNYRAPRSSWKFAILIPALWFAVTLAAGNRQSDLAQAAQFVACGEYVRAPSEHMREVVSAIDDVWDAHVKVYESVAVRPPHARRGGCVMYNSTYMKALLQDLLVRDRNAAEYMLYAIMAHEVGHELHDDFSPARAEVSGMTKELEADRFAGYTLERLNIGLDSVTPYYSLAGDEFTGAIGRPSSHGDSMRRTAALRTGWEHAEWNQPEDYQSLSPGD